MDYFDTSASAGQDVTGSDEIATPVLTTETEPSGVDSHTRKKRKRKQITDISGIESSVIDFVAGRALLYHLFSFRQIGFALRDHQYYFQRWRDSVRPPLPSGSSWSRECWPLGMLRPDVNLFAVTSVCCFIRLCLGNLLHHYQCTCQRYIIFRVFDAQLYVADSLLATCRG